MQVKVCPKCGAENGIDKASCSGCYASLEDVAPTEGKERPAPAQTQPREQPRVAQPQSSPGAAASDGPPPPNYGPPPGAPTFSHGPAVSERRSSPMKSGPNWGAIVFAVVLIGAAAFVGWWFFMKPTAPEAVVQKFRDATTARDFDTFKSCLCQGDIAMMAKVTGGEQALRAQWENAPKAAPSKDANYTTTYENSGATAVVEMKSKEPSSPSAGTEFVLLQEGGQWKIDLKATYTRKVKKAFP